MKTVRITTTQNIDIDYDVASLSERIAARIIDYLIFMCIYMIFIIVVMSYFGITTNDGRLDSALAGTGIVILIVVWLAVCVFYDLLTEIFLNGQSIGKRSVKIRVISLNGTRPSVGQYILRWIFRILDFGISMGTAAVITVAFSDKKQRIGDMVAGTTLVKTSPRNKFNDLIFGPPGADYVPTYKEVIQLTDHDIVLIHDVIKNFNRTRNSNLVYKLALRIKAFLHVKYPPEINEYQFLEIILNDYNFLIANTGV
jgi:uncharacterized RDD family membrane protein YckC